MANKESPVSTLFAILATTRGAVGMVASSDPLTDAGGGSNPRWSTGKAQD